MSSTSTAYSSTTVKNRQPKQEDVQFSKALSRIRASGKPVPLEDTSDIGQWQPVLEEMNAAALENQVEVALAALVKSNPRLNAILSLPVETDIDQDQEEKPDKRFLKDSAGNKILRLYSIEDIYETPDPEYLITRILEEATISLLYGVSGTGKTFTALDIALCIAHGEPWHGRRVKQGIAWYVNTEGARGLKKRLKAWYAEHPYLKPSSNFKVIPWSLDLRENFLELQNTIEQEQQKPALITFDNFSMCAPGVNQNLQEEISPILGRISGLAQEYGCHGMIVHHTNKVGDFNGTQAFRNHVDTMIELRKEDIADKNSAILVVSQKTRDEDLFKTIKTELKRVVLSVNQDTGEEVTSCVVVESSEPVKQEGLKDTAQNILDILGDNTYGSEEWRKLVTSELHISPATFERYKKELFEKRYIHKVKVEGKAYEQYRKVDSTSSVTSEGSRDE